MTIINFSDLHWHIIVVAVVWIHPADMLESQHPAPPVGQQRKLVVVLIGVTLSCDILPLVQVIITQPVTCRLMSEVLTLVFIDTEKVSNIINI